MSASGALRLRLRADRGERTAPRRRASRSFCVMDIVEFLGGVRCERARCSGTLPRQGRARLSTRDGRSGSQALAAASARRRGGRRWRRGGRRRRRRRGAPSAAAPAAAEAASSGGCRRLRRIAVEDQAAPPLQVGVANEGVLVERDVVDARGVAPSRLGARVDDLQHVQTPTCVARAVEERRRRREPVERQRERCRARSTGRGSAARRRRRRRRPSGRASGRSPRSDGRCPSRWRRRGRRPGRTGCSSPTRIASSKPCCELALQHVVDRRPGVGEVVEEVADAAAHRLRARRRRRPSRPA